jgi:HSP20 family molecular chaperone IbpA
MTRWGRFAEIGWFTPAVDVHEETDALIVRVVLGDVHPENVKIIATDRLLTIRHAVFSRSFELPESIDGSDAIAIMSDGVLTVRVPRRRTRSSDTFAA